MPKIRIHELAKQLGKTNKEIIDLLSAKGIEAKSHMSSLEEEQVKSLKNTVDNTSDKKKAAASSDKDQGAADKPKKKSIIRVFRSQNASGALPDKPKKKKNVSQKSENTSEQKSEGQNQANKQAQQTQKAVEPKKEHAQKAKQGEGKAQEKAPAAPTSQPVQEHTKSAPASNKPQKREQQKEQDAKRQSGQKQKNPSPRQQASQDKGRQQPSGNQRQKTQGRGRANEQRQPKNSETLKTPADKKQSQDRAQKNAQPRGEQRKQSNARQSDFNKRQQHGSASRDSVRKTSQNADISMGMRKNTRDFKKDNKERDQRRDERKNSNRPNQNLNRRPNQKLPKALGKPAPKKQEEKKEVVKEILLPEKITIRELAEKMKMQPAVIVKKLFMEGVMVTVNHEIDFEKAQEIAFSYDIIADMEEKVDVIAELLKEDDENVENMEARPPVVCVMGHVDHGKTSLLDAIRNTHVIDREAGGITQHIGAYVVQINGQKITFLDTPGHEAFTAMRMRGANATDIAVLVVAADDGVMPQTVEAISHARAAEVEIIVAINKIDKPNANIERVKQELSEQGLVPEDWGGNTIFVPVSAHTHEGIDNLLEMILLTAEVSELKANPKRKARGLVIEAKLDKGKGTVATILVQKGTLRQGDFIAAGACSGKVRAMVDDKGCKVREAGPSVPVEILGLGDVPGAGDVLVAFENDKEAKNFAATFVNESKNRLIDETKSRMSLDDLFSQIKAGNVKELPLIVKADVQGSVEAIRQSLEKISNDEVMVRVIHGGVGSINESDVSLASASNAIIIGFNVRPDPTAKISAMQEGVDVRLYRVIYQAIEDVESAMKGMLEAVYEEHVVGHAEIRQLFKASGVGTIAGSYVTDGIFKRSCLVRIYRGEDKIHEGALASLKRFKDDVKEVKEGYECGIVIEDFNDLMEEDRIEAYEMVEVER